MKKLLLPVFATSIMAFSSTLIAQDTDKSITELQCDSVKKEFSALQSQLPVQVDYMTSIVGLSAVMGSERCLVSFSYSYKEDVMVKEVVQGSEGALDSNEALAFLKSDEGRNILKIILKQQAEAIFEDLGAEAPGVTYQMTYQSDDINLKPITFQF